MEVYQIFAWVFLALVLLGIPLFSMARNEWAYRREVRRRLTEMGRLHQWQERQLNLDARGDLHTKAPKPPGAFRPSDGNGKDQDRAV